MPKELKTGDDFIQHAKGNGAHVEDAGRKRGQPFTKITTPNGSMYITPGKQPLDFRTRKNYRHWFRLLGLICILLVALTIVDYTIGILTILSWFGINA